MPDMVITRAPLRVSFVGGGSDIPEGRGATISAAIDKYIYCCVKRRRDSKYYISWSQKEIADSVEDIKHEIAREILTELGFVEGGIEISFMADIPSSGSGLGSSGAVGVALMHALFAMKGYPVVDFEWIAKRCAKIQRDRLGNKQGSQDEYTSALGGVLYLKYMECYEDPVEIEHIRRLGDFEFRMLSDHFLLFEPRDVVGRKASSVLETYTITKNFRDECCGLARHTSQAISEGDLRSVGIWMHSHHELKCGLTEMYRPPTGCDALDAASIYYKLCGAGSTGHILVYSEPNDHVAKIDLVSKSWGPNVPFKFVRKGSEVIWQM